VGGKGSGKGSGNEGGVKASSTSLLSDVALVVDQEDNASLIRLIKNKVGEYRERTE
jgi:hypothetical protein